jgi:hypothetical protein
LGIQKLGHFGRIDFTLPAYIRFQKIIDVKIIRMAVDILKIGEYFELLMVLLQLFNKSGKGLRISFRIDVK